jgi:hypothetical protein
MTSNLSQRRRTDLDLFITNNYRRASGYRSGCRGRGYSTFSDLKNFSACFRTAMILAELVSSAAKDLMNGDGVC